LITIRSFIASCRGAVRLYLFRDEYIFDVERAVVIETPQLGHATYVFEKPRNMEAFLALYSKTCKDDIRRNRDNTAEKLGFLGRVVHGSNPKVWLKELRERIWRKRLDPTIIMGRCVCPPAAGTSIGSASADPS
jgi:hypothetical protein